MSPAPGRPARCLAAQLLLSGQSRLCAKARNQRAWPNSRRHVLAQPRSQKKRRPSDRCHCLGSWLLEVSLRSGLHHQSVCHSLCKQLVRLVLRVKIVG